MNYPNFFSLRNVRLIALLFFTIVILGCSTSSTSTIILDRHRQIMKEHPGRTHYVTAIPIVFSGDIRNFEDFVNFACGNNNRKLYHLNMKDLPSTSFGLGMGSRSGVEEVAMRQCEERQSNILLNHICIVQLYNESDVCEASASDAYRRYQRAIEQRLQRYAQEQEKLAQEQSQRLTSTCQSFGFQSNTPAMNSCRFELHKSLLQIEAIREAASIQRDAVYAAAEEARKLREFEQGMALLRGSAGILHSMQNKNPSLLCTYNTFMKTITCN